MTNVVAMQNDTRLEDFEKFVKEQGYAAAKGKDALPALALGFVRAIADKVIEVGKDKNGDNAAARYFKKYAECEGKKAFHDRSTGSQKAQISKFKQLQDAADNPKWDFDKVLNRGVVIRQTAIDDGIEVKSPFPAYVDLAREQLKYDDELDDAMIYATVIKGDSTKAVTLEGQLKKAHKILEQIETGENKHGIKDQSPEVTIARESLDARIAALALKTQQDAAIKVGLEAGILALNEDGTYSAK